MLISEVTPEMIAKALTLPSRGLVWNPVNGQIVYRKFDAPHRLTKLTDDNCLETDDYCLDGESLDLFTLKDKCVWMPDPSEIRDLAIQIRGFYFLSLEKKSSSPEKWMAVYGNTSGTPFSEGATPWEAEFNFLNDYIIGICQP